MTAPAGTRSVRDGGTADSWVLATDGRRLGSMVAAVRGLGGRVTVAAVGPQALAAAAGAAGPDAVAWIETADGRPAEAYAHVVAHAVAAARPRVVLAAATPEGRALLGVSAEALDAALVTGLVSTALDGDIVVVERTGLSGRVNETLGARGPLAGLFVGEDAPRAPMAGTPPIERLDAGSPADMRIESSGPAPGASGGVTTADRVVAIGCGLKARADLGLVEGLAAALGAEVACSMPIADDFGWIAKERYVGRSGQHIAPRLYLAIGISGTPQHMEGVRDAKVVAAVNSDPHAHIFRRADYGVVGDLYEVIPALLAALGK